MLSAQSTLFIPMTDLSTRSKENNLDTPQASLSKDSLTGELARILDHFAYNILSDDTSGYKTDFKHGLEVCLHNLNTFNKTPDRFLKFTDQGTCQFMLEDLDSSIKEFEKLHSDVAENHTLLNNIKNFILNVLSYITDSLGISDITGKQSLQNHAVDRLYSKIVSQLKELQATVNGAINDMGRQQLIDSEQELDTLKHTEIFIDVLIKNFEQSQEKLTNISLELDNVNTALEANGQKLDEAYQTLSLFNKEASRELNRFYGYSDNYLALQDVLIPELINDINTLKGEKRNLEAEVERLNALEKQSIENREVIQENIMENQLRAAALKQSLSDYHQNSEVLYYFSEIQQKIPQLKQTVNNVFYALSATYV